MKKIVYWLPTLIWMIVIFGFSSQPSLHASAFDLLDFLIKKTAHFMEYLILATLMFFSLKKTVPKPTPSLFWFTLVISIIYAAGDEIHQLFVPGREGRLRDVLIDSSGIVTALYLIKKHFSKA
jgi:VanZ family protein